MAASSGSQALANGRQHKTYDQGMCQKYVRDPCWRVGSLYGSAIDAWNGSTQKHKGDRSPPVGAPLYYKGGQYGHAVIATESHMRSTDCPSSGKVGEDDIGWPERAWGYSYLGWTGDINGVDLPLTDKGTEDEDDMPLNNEDLDKIANRVWSQKVGEDKESVGTIMVRVNPGPAGIAAAVAERVWAFVTTSAIDGAKVTVLNLLRYAQGDARKAMQNTSD